MKKLHLRYRRYSFVVIIWNPSDPSTLFFSLSSRVFLLPLSHPSFLIFLPLDLKIVCVFWFQIVSLTSPLRDRATPGWPYLPVLEESSSVSSLVVCLGLGGGAVRSLEQGDLGMFVVGGRSPEQGDFPWPGSSQTCCLAWGLAVCCSTFTPTTKSCR